MTVKTDRAIFGLIFVLVLIGSIILYVFVLDNTVKAVAFTLALLASTGCGYSLARLVSKR